MANDRAVVLREENVSGVQRECGVECGCRNCCQGKGTLTLFCFRSEGDIIAQSKWLTRQSASKSVSALESEQGTASLGEEEEDFLTRVITSSGKANTSKRAGSLCFGTVSLGSGLSGSEGLQGGNAGPLLTGGGLILIHTDVHNSVYFSVTLKRAREKLLHSRSTTFKCTWYIIERIVQ